jgi:hypothetical protein
MIEDSVMLETDSRKDTIVFVYDWELVYHHGKGYLSVPPALICSIA